MGKEVSNLGRTTIQIIKKYTVAEETHAVLPRPQWGEGVVQECETALTVPALNKSSINPSIKLSLNPSIICRKRGASWTGRLMGGEDEDSYYLGETPRLL